MSRLVFILLGCAATGLFLAASCSKPPGQAEYDRGLYELKRDNLVRARALLEKSISRRPGSDENALAYNYLGVTTWKLGQYQAAQEAFEDSRRLSPALAEPIYNLALLYQHQGDDARAAKLLEEAAQIDETNPRPLEYLAQLYVERRQWQNARRLLYAALDRKPNSPRALTSLALIDLETSGAEKSIESHLLALEKNPRYAPALFNIGLIYLTRIDDPVRAREYFKRYLAQKPEGPSADFARTTLAQTISAQPAPRASTEEKSTPAPQTETASTQTTQARAAQQTPEELDAATIQQATSLAEVGNISSALNQLLKAADDAGKAKRLPAQERLLRAATNIAFEEAQSYLALADFLMERQQPENAIRAYKQAAALEPQSFDAQYGMARAALKIGELDTALVGLTTATRLNPRSVDAQWDLARTLDTRVQSPDRAIDAYRDFEKRFPGDPRTQLIPNRIKALTPAARAAATPKPAPQPKPTPPPQPPPEIVSRPAPAPAQTVEPRVQPRPQPRVEPVPRPQQASKPPPKLNLRKPARRDTVAATTAFNEGRRLLEQRKWNQAIAAFTRAAELDDRFTAAFYNLGFTYSTMGNREMAKAAYVETLALQPDLHEARYNLALLYFQDADYNTATALAQEVVRLKPDYAVAHYLLGQIYSARPETISQARAAYSRFLDLAPTHPAAAVVRQWLATH